MMDALTNNDASVALMNFTRSPSEALQGLKDAKRIKEAAREFEAVFISEMMKPMFEDLEVNSQFGGGQAEKIFRSVMLQEYGKQISSTNRIGIAEKVEEAMIKIQEKQAKAETSIQKGDTHEKS